MLFKWYGARYQLLFWRKLIPYGFRPFVSELEWTPKGYAPLMGGSKLEGKVALITGGHKGIGLSIAKTFLREGAKVIITGRDKARLEKVCAGMDSFNISFMEWDISKTSLCRQYFLRANSIYGKIDILINNAGVTTDDITRKPFEKMTDDHFHYVHDINVIGTRFMCETFADVNGSGEILNVISNTALYASKDAYFLSKRAIYSFTKMFGVECLRQGRTIRVNGICPGPIKTDMTFRAGGNMYRGDIANHRIGLPEEIAELALMVVYSSLHGMKGKVVTCDGGETLM